MVPTKRCGVLGVVGADPPVSTGSGPLCPVTEAETAADRVRHVLAVPFADGTV